MSKRNHSRPHLLVLLACGLTACPILTSAQPAEPRAVFGTGGGNASGGPYALTDTVGEASVGSTSSASYQITEGFWGTFGSPLTVANFNTTAGSNQLIAIPIAPLLAGSDADGNPVSFVTAAGAPHGTVATTSGAIDYTPAPGFTGTDNFNFTVTDGEGDTANGTIFVTVLPTQIAISISPLPDIGTDQPSQPFTVPVTVTPSANYVLQATSANPKVVPNANLSFSGTAGHYTLTITPASGQTGSSLITISAQASGQTATAAFTANFGLFANIAFHPPNSSITFTANPGLSCSVQYTTNLGNTNWTTLGPAVESPPGSFHFTDPSPVDMARFYRLIVP